MSNRDAIAIAEAFKALSKAVKRKAYESDSDDYIEQPTNRGSKLKKRARFVRRGQIGPPSGPPLYRESVEHAGHQRAVISRNPPLIDDEGYEIDSEDEPERVVEAQTEADGVNPYASIRLEDILAPLTSSADLANHATLSRPFLSTALTELSTQGLNLMHKESEALWKVRPLLTRLCGDHTWASCNMMLGSNDGELFERRNGGGPQHRHPQQRSHAPTGEAQKPASPPTVNGASAGASLKDRPSSVARDADQNPAADDKADKQDDPDITMEDLELQNQSTTVTGADREVAAANGDKSLENGTLKEKEGGHKETAPGSKDKQPSASATNGELPTTVPAATKHPLAPGETNPTKTDLVKTNGQEGSGTRGAQAGAPDAPQAVNGTTVAPGLTDEEVIHPFFLAPSSAYPDRDAGLPPQDAEDVRRLLQLYVQKQEEVCRGTKELYEGLLRADRLRQMVLKWSKAEGHCGANRELSDGEDWYDKEEWGLTDDLKKGQDEEEEETAKDQPKKTRNRR